MTGDVLIAVVVVLFGAGVVRMGASTVAEKREAVTNAERVEGVVPHGVREVSTTDTEGDLDTQYLVNVEYRYTCQGRTYTNDGERAL